MPCNKCLLKQEKGGSLWIQKINLKKGSLRRWLKIKKDKIISLTLLKKLNKMKVGSKTEYGKLTTHRKRQINLAINFRKMKKK